MADLRSDSRGGHGRHRCCQAADGTRRGRGQGALIEPLVLAALTRSEAHGYDLVRTVEEITQGEVVPDAGGIYRVLRRLEADGVVSSHWEEGAAGPQRRSYRLTDDGRELLKHWMGHLEERRRSLEVLIQAVSEASAKG
ncbi:MAG: PadR family transcriptional regulator [Coriobacteriia bacterium]|nr:PadR family transcriptional regulator [Coriobacteriia bacterium]